MHFFEIIFHRHARFFYISMLIRHAQSRFWISCREFNGKIGGRLLIAISLHVITERDNIVSLFKCLYLMAEKSEPFQCGTEMRPGYSFMDHIHHIAMATTYRDKNWKFSWKMWEAFWDLQQQSDRKSFIFNRRFELFWWMVQHGWAEFKCICEWRRAANQWEWLDCLYSWIHLYLELNAY